MYASYVLPGGDEGIDREPVTNTTIDHEVEMATKKTEWLSTERVTGRSKTVKWLGVELTLGRNGNR